MTNREMIHALDRAIDPALSPQEREHTLGALRWRLESEDEGGPGAALLAGAKGRDDAPASSSSMTDREIIDALDRAIDPIVNPYGGPTRNPSEAHPVLDAQAVRCCLYALGVLRGKLESGGANQVPGGMPGSA
jgi:hypothetical protein